MSRNEKNYIYVYRVGFTAGVDFRRMMYDDPNCQGKLRACRVGILCNYYKDGVREAYHQNYAYAEYKAIVDQARRKDYLEPQYIPVVGVLTEKGEEIFRAKRREILRDEGLKAKLYYMEEGILGYTPVMLRPIVAVYERQGEGGFLLE